MASTIARGLLAVFSLTLGFFFIFVGSLKTIPSVNEEVYKEMRKGFVRFAEVFPLRNIINQTGYHLDPQVYRQVVGVTEIVGGVCLAIVPGPLKKLANVVLFITMLGGAYSHMAIGDEPGKMVPALACAALLALRFLLHAWLYSGPSQTTIETSEGRRGKKKE